MKSSLTVLLLTAVVFLQACGPAAPLLTLPSEASEALAERKAEFPAQPIIAVTDGEGNRDYLETPDDKTVEEASATIYEIGSVTKVFTGLMLAQYAAEGKVDLKDPIREYLPDSVQVPNKNGKMIRLVDLATHTSGLARMPDNFAPRDPANPYADYTVAQMYDYLSRATLASAPGEKYAYSNFGMGLLGHILERIGGMTWEQLVNERVLKPLGMTSSYVSLPITARQRFIEGYAGVSVASAWDIRTLTGAGGLRSSTADMLRFIEAYLKAGEHPLKEALQLSMQPHYTAPDSSLSHGLGWHITHSDAGDIHWHNGATGGYKSCIGFRKDLGAGAVGLVNNSSVDMTDIVLSLLDTTYQVRRYPPTVSVPTDLLDSYEGRYQLGPGFVITISHRDGKLYAQATGQDEFRIYPKTQSRFAYRVVEAEIEFAPPVGNTCPSITLYQAGRELPANRIEAEQ